MSAPRDSRDRGLPVVLLHGFLGSPSDWDPLLAEFRAQSHGECIAVDLLDLARRTSGPPRLTSLAATLAADLRREPSCLRGFDVIGYSLGGRIAMALSAARPAAVADECAPRCITLLSASPGIDGECERAARASADHRLAERLEQISQVVDVAARRGLCESFLNDWYSQLLFASLHSHRGFLALANRRCDDLTRAGAALTWAAVLAECSQGTAQSWWQHVATHAAEFSMVVGARDDRYCVLAERARSIGVRVTRVENAGHAVHLEAPAVVAKLVAAHRRAHAQESLSGCQNQ